jgi:hypothetical protein
VTTKDAGPTVEFKGRLHLWNAALLEVRLLLNDACRASAARDLHAVPTGEITEASRSAHPFGTWIDLNDVYDNYRALAAVYFCQVFKEGNAASGLAGRNRDPSIVAERDNIVAIALPTADDQARFAGLLAALEAARDKVLAHADGNAFSISHSSRMVISHTHGESLRKVDLDFWLRAARALQDEVQLRMGRLRIDSGMIGS